MRHAMEEVAPRDAVGVEGARWGEAGIGEVAEPRDEGGGLSWAQTAHGDGRVPIGGSLREGVDGAQGRCHYVVSVQDSEFAPPMARSINIAVEEDWTPDADIPLLNLPKRALGP
jgi:hypothetical protein